MSLILKNTIDAYIPNYCLSKKGGHVLQKNTCFQCMVNAEMQANHSVCVLLLIGLISILFFLSGCTRRPSDDSELPFTIVREYGKSVDWSHANNLIATVFRGDDGYFDVMIFDPDSTWEQCLTCNKTEIPQLHIGNPCWHPSGEYIVFTGEKAGIPKAFDTSSIPGRGLYHDLYVMNANGTLFWKMYETSNILTDVQGVIHPQFSHSGEKLLWSERVGPGDDDRHQWGEWGVKVADFSVVDDTPLINNIQLYQPGEQAQFYETHMFSFDGSSVLFAANLLMDQLPTGMDIYSYNLENDVLTALTSTYDDWDEHAHYSPDGTSIAWMSSTGFDIDYVSIDDWPQYLITELWLMNADGSEKTQLTYFNDSNYSEYTGSRTIVGDSAWSPDGKQIVAAITYEDSAGDLVDIQLVMITFT